MTSSRFWNHPLLPIGCVLIVLGLGNWWVSRGKLSEYSARLQASQQVSSSDLTLFDDLDQRTNATLLRRLHRAATVHSMSAAKRDFYALVNNGGRMITILGMALLAAGLVRLAGDENS